MKKSKKTTEQTPETVEETVEAEETTTETEDPAAEQGQQEEEAAEETAAEDDSEEDPAEDAAQDEPSDDQEVVEAQPAAEASEGGDPAVATLQTQLLEARSQLAAYAAGVAPDMIADAVTLATAEAQRSGEVTEAAITKAMANVLKRHPEWKANAGKTGTKKTGGFKLGADPDNSGAVKKTGGNDNRSTKRWNRFK